MGKILVITMLWCLPFYVEAQKGPVMIDFDYKVSLRCNDLVVDWNLDGDFDDPKEQVLNNEKLVKVCIDYKEEGVMHFSVDAGSKSISKTELKDVGLFVLTTDKSRTYFVKDKAGAVLALYALSDGNSTIVIYEPFMRQRYLGE